jgi:hypothetical protein
MTYIADLELCRYHPGPLDADNWSVPLRAVGWLEYPELFNTGVSPASVLRKVREVVEQTHAAFPHYCFRGGMACTLCLAKEIQSEPPNWSQENILMPGSGAVYAAPVGIVHYMEAHSYLPPTEFIEAALRCPDVGSEDYFQALRRANNGNEPPLKSIASYSSELEQWKAKWRSIRGDGPIK